MKRSLTLLAVVIAAAAAGGYWYVQGKQPQRDGEAALPGLQAPVSVRYDTRGVPHLQAQNEADLYRALGYVHAQDRLFQMEITRRLARGELAEVLGPKLVETDTLFRSLRIAEQAEKMVARQDKQSPAWLALQAYLDGVNAWQASHPEPMEFDLLGITPRPFTAQDTLSIAGFMAYSFAAAFRTEPLLTYIRDQFGTDYLRVFDLEWYPEGALGLADADWKTLGRLAQVSESALADAGLPQFEGSNAWAVSGTRTASGKPLLAGDPHIRFAVPAVWYEAELSAPGFNLYGYHQALNPFASLGHNRDFGWSLTMFQNDDVDLIAEQVNPDNPEQVKIAGQWQTLASTREQIRVKGEDPVAITLRRSSHGPIVNNVLGKDAGTRPIALWWAFLETENPILDGFYEVNRANTLGKMRSAAAKIHAPGLNLVWANARGDIGWWAAAQLPVRPASVNPAFMLDGATNQADKAGFYPFSANPQQENPASGYIVSANFQPPSPTGMRIPGYYNLADRGRQLDRHLASDGVKWSLDNTRALQLDTATDYGPRTLGPLLGILREAAKDDQERELVEQLAAWRGDYPLDSVNATVFTQFLYELARAAMQDELGDAWFETLLSTRVIDAALPRLAADERSPWWQVKGSNEPGGRAEVVKRAWGHALAHLRELMGSDPTGWQWGKAHTLTHGHPLGLQKPLNILFNVGPFAAPGSHEVPNNLSAKIGPAPWPVTYGPSTRRIIDFADAGTALSINPVGQSGVVFDRHYADQAKDYMEGRYQRAWLGLAGDTEGTLRLVWERARPAMQAPPTQLTPH